MWRALETEIGPREEAMAASALLGELIGTAFAEYGRIAKTLHLRSLPVDSGRQKAKARSHPLPAILNV